MASHSSVLAWRIRGMGEPGGLPSMGSHSVRHDWSDLAAAAAAAFQSRSIWCSLNQCILVYTSLDWSILVYTSLHLKSVVFRSDQKFQRVQISCSVMSNSLQPQEPQHARPPCPSPAPRTHPNPCPLSRWCRPTISSSVVPFSSCLQSFPAPGSFQMSQLFASSGQSIGVSALTSVLPMNIQDWFTLGWTAWTSLQSKGLPRVFSNTTVQKHQFFSA